jgi:hypothetical protein
MAQIVTAPRIQAIDSNGNPYVGALLYIYDAGTSTPRTTYSDSGLSVANSQPMEANNALGIFGPIFVSTSGNNLKLEFRTSAGVVIPELGQDNVPLIQFTAAELGSTLFPRTPAETAAGVTPGDETRQAEPVYDLLRLGLVPNSTGDRAANSAALSTLLDPTSNGPRGRFVFPNTTGSDTYYFAPLPIEIRDGCRLDLGGCTLDMAGTFTAELELHAFLSCRRDVEICNGSINVNYDGSAGTNNGLVMRLGQRRGYSFAGVDDADEEGLTVSLGNIHIHDLRITTNNPGPSVACSLLGGLQNTTIERIVGNCSNVVEYLFYYEFGEYHYESTVANQTTSHALNLVFDQITGKNLKDDDSGAVVSVVGANSTRATNIHGDTCFTVVTIRCGEALFYNVGAPYVIGGRTRWQYLSNITGVNVVSNALTLIGAESDSGGYLAGESLSDDELCDLQGFVVDGFSLDSGVYCNGPLIMRGGTIRGGGGSGSLIIGADCLSAEIYGTHVLGGAASGIRAEISDSVRNTPRKKRLLVSGVKIAGNVGEGILLGLCESARIENCQLGYATAIGDAGNESTQTSGVSVSSDGNGVVCDGNFVAVAGGGTAYVLAGTGDRGCDLRHTRNTRSRSGSWMIDGLAQDTATNIAEDGAAINQADKYAGKAVRDTSNNRIMYARGAGATDPWDSADGGTAVTPS